MATATEEVDVRWLQQRLNQLGYCAGPEDGLWGQKTFDGIVEYASANRLHDAPISGTSARWRAVIPTAVRVALDAGTGGRTPCRPAPTPDRSTTLVPPVVEAPTPSRRLSTRTKWVLFGLGAAGLLVGGLLMGHALGRRRR